MRRKKRDLNSTSKIRECLGILFSSLKEDFNGSMFEENFEPELSKLTQKDFILFMGGYRLTLKLRDI